MAAADNADDEKQLQECLQVGKDYAVALMLETERKRLMSDKKIEALPPQDQKRVLELASYYTCSNINKTHLIYGLRMAMQLAYGAGNFNSSTSFAKRLVNEGEILRNTAQLQQIELTARKVLKACEARGTEAIQTDFDRDHPESLRLCSHDLIPIAPGAATVKCPYCGAEYQERYRGQQCKVCDVAEIGANVLGILFRPL